MTCNPIVDDDGKVVGFVCSRNRARVMCSTCETRQATRLCDYPLRGALTGTTCDKPLCASCTRSGTPKQPKTVEEMGDTYDLCPAHARMEKGTR